EQAELPHQLVTVCLGPRMERDRKSTDVNGDEPVAHAAIADLACALHPLVVGGDDVSMSRSSSNRNASRSGSIDVPGSSSRTSHHTVLPAGRLVVPHAAASEPTSPRPRPVVASTPYSRARGLRGLPSLTPMRTVPSLRRSRVTRYS